jgi:hypothetical protein
MPAAQEGNFVLKLEEELRQKTNMEAGKPVWSFPG